MTVRRIGLASRTSRLRSNELRKVANALNIQVQEHLAGPWGIEALVVALDDPNHVDADMWPIYVVDENLPNRVLGTHHADDTNPYAAVCYGPDWTIAASHECLEMLVDPGGNHLRSGPALRLDPTSLQISIDSSETCDYLVEICDPVQASACAYRVAGVYVSDFYFPEYLTGTATGLPLSHTGALTTPLSLTNGGYISWIRRDGSMWQLVINDFRPQLIEIPLAKALSAGAYVLRRSLRGIVDSLTKDTITSSLASDKRKGPLRPFELPAIHKLRRWSKRSRSAALAKRRQAIQVDISCSAHWHQNVTRCCD